MKSEGEKDTIKRLLALKEVTYFDTEEGLTPFARNCRQFETWEQEWLDKQTTVHPKQRRVLFGFYERLETQAYAIEDRSGDAVIGLSAFFGAQLLSFFYLMLARSPSFSEIGTPTLERTNEDVFRLFRRTGQVAPVCSERRQLALQLASLAMRFLTAHEFTHILNGHLRLQMQEGDVHGNAFAWASERPRSLASKDDLLRSQTLEWDADSGAAVETIGISIGGAQSDLVRWTTATYGMFRLFDGPLLQASSHPAPINRAISSLLTFAAVQEKMDPGNTEVHLGRAITQAVDEVESVLTEFYEKEYSRPEQGIIDAFSGHNVIPYEGEWQRLRPLLEPLATRSGELAPA